MYLRIAVLLILAIGVLGIDEFKNNRELLNCIQTCEPPISACLKSIESACAKAYMSCHGSKNFLVCVESANSLMMQDIAKCMRKDCKNMEEEQFKPSDGRSDDMSEFRRFKPLTIDQAAAKETENDDIQEEKKETLKTQPTDPTKNKGK